MKYEEFKLRVIESLWEEDFKHLYDEMTKPIGVEEIEDFLHHASWQSKKGLAKIIQPLTRKQRFVVGNMSVIDHMKAISQLVDWNKRPWATALKLGFMTKDIMPNNDRIADPFCTIPRPTQKYREMTAEQKAEAWVRWRMKNYTIPGGESGELREGAYVALCEQLMFGKTIEDLCAAAGISTKIEVKE